MSLGDGAALTLVTDGQRQATAARVAVIDIGSNSVRMVVYEHGCQSRCSMKKPVRFERWFGETGRRRHRRSPPPSLFERFANSWMRWRSCGWTYSRQQRCATLSMARSSYVSPP